MSQMLAVLLLFMALVAGAPDGKEGAGPSGPPPNWLAQQLYAILSGNPPPPPASAETAPHSAPAGPAKGMGPMGTPVTPPPVLAATTSKAAPENPPWRREAAPAPIEVPDDAPKNATTPNPAASSKAPGGASLDLAVRNCRVCRENAYSGRGICLNKNCEACHDQSSN